MTEDHITAAFAIWHERNMRVWKLDILLITDAGVEVLNAHALPMPEDRAAVADATLRGFRK